MSDAQHTQIVDSLRGSAKVFRKHPVYSSDGDGVLLTTQADECDEAADIITDLLEALEDFDNWFCSFNPDDQHSRMVGRKVVIRARSAISRARNGGNNA